MRFAMAFLISAGLAFSANLELPVDSGRLVVDPALEYRSWQGGFDGSGQRQSYGPDVSISATSLGIAVKYVFLPGLEADVGECAVIQQISTPGFSSSPTIGFDRPWVGLKYLHPVGVGALASVSLPWGSPDLVGSKTPTTFSGGLLANARLGPVDLDGAAVGSRSTQPAGGTWLGDSILIQMRARYRLNRRWWASMGAVWSSYEGAEIPGWIPPRSGWFLRLEPGIRFGLSNFTTLQFVVPVEVAGENAPAGFGFRIETIGAGP